MKSAIFATHNPDAYGPAHMILQMIKKYDVKDVLTLDNLIQELQIRPHDAVLMDANLGYPGQNFSEPAETVFFRTSYAGQTIQQRIQLNLMKFVAFTNNSDLVSTCEIKNIPVVSGIDLAHYITKHF